MTTARLDNIAHANLRLRAGHGPEFGDAVNQVPLYANEFAAAQRDYPILFRRGEDGALQALAILGLDRDENLFLEGRRWNARYVPALMRRGPFLIGLSGDGDPIIHIDTDHPRVMAHGPDSTEGADSLPLFLPHGGHAPALEAALEALRTIHLGHEAAPVLTQHFTDLDLVAPVRLEVSLSDTQVYDFEGYLAVTPEKIAALDGAALERLNKAGLLDIAIFAAASLSNMNQLITRKNARLRAGA